MPGVGEGAPLGCRKPRHRKEKPRTTFDLPLALCARELLNSSWRIFFFLTRPSSLSGQSGVAGPETVPRDDPTRDLSSSLVHWEGWPVSRERRKSAKYDLWCKCKWISRFRGIMTLFIELGAVFVVECCSFAKNVWNCLQLNKWFMVEIVSGIRFVKLWFYLLEMVFREKNRFY